jgi:hypothetical protein
MTPVRPDGLNPGRYRQLPDLIGGGLYNKRAIEIISTGQAVKTEAFQGLLDIHHCRRRD